MRTEHYFCDKCKTEVANSKMITKFTIGVGSLFSGPYERFKSYRDIELCPACAEKVGVIVKEEKPVEHSPELSDRLYEIMQELVQEIIHNN